MSADATDLFVPRARRRRRLGVVFAAACLLLTLLAVAILFVLLGRVLGEAWGRLDAALLVENTNLIDPARGGVRPAIWGSVWLMCTTAIVTVPLGIGAAVYLNEYAPNNRLTRLIHLNIENLAGVPSIVYGIIGLAIFINVFRLGNSVLAGALTLSLLVMPVVVIASREALMAVPDTLRQASYALGATRWQTVRDQVLPAAMPGVMTGVILALSRAVGEAAPLVMIGAFTLLDTVPGEGLTAYAPTIAGAWAWLRDALLSPFAALPIQVYNFADSQDRDVQTLGAATIVVLLGLLLTMNMVAVGIRAWYQRNRAW